MSHQPTLAVPYDSAEQQREAATLGMWIFLATEVLFFGGLFVAYAVYRYEYPESYVIGSTHLSMMSGAIMTAVLLLGSLLVAYSDIQIRSSEPNKSAIVRNLAMTAVLGIIFLGLEFREYGMLIEEGLFPGAGFNSQRFSEHSLDGRSIEMFFCLFFMITGLHAFHMIMGVSLVIGMAITIHRAEEKSRWQSWLENVGLYWHFVDIIWVFLFPLFYIVERS